MFPLHNNMPSLWIIWEEIATIVGEFGLGDDPEKGGRMFTQGRGDQHKNLYLLLALVAHNLLYPLSTGDSWQPVASFEAITGVLYTVTLLSCLVSVYEDPKKQGHDRIAMSLLFEAYSEMIRGGYSKLNVTLTTTPTLNWPSSTGTPLPPKPACARS